MTGQLVTDRPILSSEKKPHNDSSHNSVDMSHGMSWRTRRTDRPTNRPMLVMNRLRLG